MAEINYDNVNDLEEYVEKLLEEKGIGKDEPDYPKTKKIVLEVLEEQISKVIEASMPKEKLDEFKNFVSVWSNEEIMEFCQKNIPDFEKLMAAVLLQYKKIYLEYVK